MSRFAMSFGTILGLTAMITTTLPLPVHAAIVGTAEVVEQSATAEQHASVREFLERDTVRSRLQALGVSPDEAQQRAGALTDEEVRLLAGKIDALPAGGDATGAIIGAILVVFLVLLFTDIIGATDVFPFVNKP